MAVYYNEFDPYAAQWIRNLVEAGLIPDGDVDERSIVDVQPDDLRGYTQCHFFAGIGGWAYAARLAGWPDDREIWTGSCPCQPFSVAGKQAGTDDPRHLWPHFFRLIGACRPAVVFGEQVSAGARRAERVDSNLQRMWAAESLLGVLQDEGQARQFEWLSCAMQGVLSRLPEEVQRVFEEANIGFFPELSAGEPGTSIGELGQAQSEAGRLTVRSGRVRAPTSGTHRQGSLRAIWDTVLSHGRSDLGQPFPGSHSSGVGLLGIERSNRAVLAQRDDEHMGCGAGLDRSRGGKETSRGTGLPSTGEVGAKPEKAFEPDWLDGVRTDLDAIGYSLGVSDIPACGIDAPHIRSRLYWLAVADADRERRDEDERPLGDEPTELGAFVAADDVFGSLEHASGIGWREGRSESELRRGWATAAGADAPSVDLGNPHIARRQERGSQCRDAGEECATLERADVRNGTFWSDAEWIRCHDGKARRAQPGAPLLVDGLPCRVALWRGFGNAIVPPLAAEVIRAFMETQP